MNRILYYSFRKKELAPKEHEYLLFRVFLFLFLKECHHRLKIPADFETSSFSAFFNHFIPVSTLSLFDLFVSV